MANHLTDCVCIRVDSPTLKLPSRHVIEGQCLGISGEQVIKAPIGGEVSRVTLIPGERLAIITLQRVV